MRSLKVKLLILFFFYAAAMISAICYSFFGQNDTNKTDKKESFDKSPFAEEFPMTVTSSIEEDSYHNIVYITLKNNTESVISAVQFLVTGKNVYGEVVENDKRFSDRLIQSLQSVKLKVVVNRRIKFADIRVYSVYYYNNCRKEWGNRKTSCKDMIKYLPVTSACQI